jgi:hypothetical protein
MKKTIIILLLTFICTLNYAKAQVTVIASGYCGDKGSCGESGSGTNLTWVLTSDSVLTIVALAQWQVIFGARGKKHHGTNIEI